MAAGPEQKKEEFELIVMAYVFYFLRPMHDQLKLQQLKLDTEHSNYANGVHIPLNGALL